MVPTHPYPFKTVPYPASPGCPFREDQEEWNPDQVQDPVRPWFQHLVGSCWFMAARGWNAWDFQSKNPGSAKKHKKGSLNASPWLSCYCLRNYVTIMVIGTWGTGTCIIVNHIWSMHWEGFIHLVEAIEALNSKNVRVGGDGWGRHITHCV